MKKIIEYTLAPVSVEFTGGVPTFRALVKVNGTVDADQLAQELSERTKQDKSLVSYFISALNEQLGDKLVSGYRVNLGQISAGLAIRGAFLSEDDRFDPARHSIVPTARACDPLKSALADADIKNLTLSLTCSVYSLMDMTTKAQNIICSTGELHVQGVNLGIDVDNIDEGVTLVDDDGVVKATATVTSSDAQTIVCSFPTLPDDGAYTLVVSCRNGARTTLAPAVGKLKGVLVQVNG